MTKANYRTMVITLRNRKALREFVREQKAKLYASPVVIPDRAAVESRPVPALFQSNPLLEGRGYLFSFDGLKRFCNWNDRSVPVLRETA